MFSDTIDAICKYKTWNAIIRPGLLIKSSTILYVRRPIWTMWLRRFDGHDRGNSRCLDACSYRHASRAPTWYGWRLHEVEPTATAPPDWVPRAGVD